LNRAVARACAFQAAKRTLVVIERRFSSEGVGTLKRSAGYRSKGQQRTRRPKSVVSAGLLKTSREYLIFRSQNRFQVREIAVEGGKDFIALVDRFFHAEKKAA
jgi:hypothetical protein